MKSSFNLRHLCPTSTRSSLQYSLRYPILTSQSARTFSTFITKPLSTYRNFTTSSIYTIRMSDKFSNTDTGDKPADPYKAKNYDHAELKEKVEDLTAFMKQCKFAMMTTRIESSGLLVSRCMALVAAVCLSLCFHLGPLRPNAYTYSSSSLQLYANCEILFVGR